MFRYVIALAFAAVLATPDLLHAQTAARTFLATTGSDGNPCSAAAPCRTLNRAIATVAAGGDVIILDSGGYGEDISIQKSVSVIASPGIVARLRTPGAGFAGVRITGVGTTVMLDGIGITGTNGGFGVLFEAGKALILRNMDINVYGPTSTDGVGIRHEANGQLTIQNSVLRNSYQCFVAESGSGGTASASITNSQAHSCFYGFTASSGAKVSIRDTSAAGAGTSICKYNFWSRGQDGASVMNLEGVASSNCEYGVYASNGTGTGRLNLSSSSITSNISAGYCDTGGGRTFGNNRLSNNSFNDLGNFSSVVEQ